MQMSVGRRVAEAVGSWLHLEFCCFRAGLLSEGALKAAAGQVLSSFPISAKGTRVYADFPHEALRTVKKKGRKKEVDFALILAGKGLPKRNAEVLIEAKWSNSTHCTPANVFTDFLRLAALKRADPNARCVFLMAGHTSSFNRLIGGMPFMSEGARNTGIGTHAYQKRVRPNPQNSEHQRYWKAPIQALLADGLGVPDSFVTQACSAHPVQSDGGTVDFQAQCWEVTEVSATLLDKALWT